VFQTGGQSNPLSDAIRSAVTPRTFRVFEISEGATELCNFLRDPKMRGQATSEPISNRIDRGGPFARRSGVREIVGRPPKDTRTTGMDRYGKPRLNDYYNNSTESNRSIGSG